MAGYSSCEFCGKELVQIFTEMYPFHVDCLKKAIETIARHTKDLNLEGPKVYTSEEALSRNDRWVVVTEGGRSYFSSEEQARTVAAKLCKQNKQPYYTAKILTKFYTL